MFKPSRCLGPGEDFVDVHFLSLKEQRKLEATKYPAIVFLNMGVLHQGSNDCFILPTVTPVHHYPKADKHDQLLQISNLFIHRIQN